MLYERIIDPDAKEENSNGSVREDCLYLQKT